MLAAEAGTFSKGGVHMKCLLIQWHTWWKNYHIQMMTDAVNPNEKSRQYMRIIYHQRELNKLIFE